MVWIIASVANLSLLPLERTLIVRQLVADFIGGLVAVAVILAIQLRHEEVHNRSALVRAAFVAELNHNVRNAVFPLCMAVQRLGDADAKRLADDAIDRINVALRDATADALARQVEYAASDVVEHREAA